MRAPAGANGGRRGERDYRYRECNKRITKGLPEMKDPTCEHAGWFADVRRILNVVEVTQPGLPIPSISATRASFRFTGITHAKDAAESVALAETILGYALNVTFVPRTEMAGDDTERYVLTGYTASGLAVDIVARAEHMSARHVPAPREDSAQARPELTGVAA